MYAKHPKIAKKWTKKYGVSKNLPEKKKDKGFGHNIEKSLF